MGNADDAIAAIVARRLKPHDLAQQVERTAQTLSPADLPMFYDLAADELLRRHDLKRAATMFANARAAEAASGAAPLAVDVWLERHHRFAEYGALGTKSVADFVKGLKTRVDPQTAFETLGQLAHRRACAGQAPWPQLPKQLSAFAKAAGQDELTAHRDLLIPLLMTRSIWESPAAMWTAWRPILVRVCADSPQVRGLLLNVRPEPESMDGWWLELLEECGATAGLIGEAEPEATPAGGRAAWLERTVWHPNLNATLRRRSRVSKLLPTQIGDLIARMAPALRADGVPVRLEGPDYWTQRIDPRVLEACLAGGVPVADLTGKAWLDLDLWLRGRRPEDGLAATVADARFAPRVLAWAAKRDATQLWPIPELRPYLTAPQEAASAPHPLDGPKVYSAVHEFGAVSGVITKGVPRLLYALRMLTKAMRDGTAASADPNLLRLGETADLAGRIEWIVLRAVAPSTPPDRRELLLALLEVWGDSVLADPATRIFHGSVAYDRDRDFAADEHGVAMGSYYAGKERRPFMALTDGSPGAEPPSLVRVEESEDGAETSEIAEIPVGWGTADRLHRLVALVRELGGVPRDPAAASVLAERTGLSRPTAEMAMAGLLGVVISNVPFMGPQERKALGLTAKQVEAGRQELVAVRDRQRTDVLLGILPDDPAELWQPGGTVALAERLAVNWVAQFGRSAAVPEATVAAAADLGKLAIPTRHVLAALAGPADSPILTRDIDSWLTPGHNGGAAWFHSEDYTVSEFTRWLPGLLSAICWAYATLPADDPVRAGIPEAVRLLRERFAHPGLVLMAGSPGYAVPTSALIERFGPEPYAGPESLPDTTADDGLTIVTIAASLGDARLYFRPAFYGADERTAELENTVSYTDSSLRMARFLSGSGCAGIVERIVSGTLPAGTCEADPRASVPDLVARVGEAHGLSADAATLYLQLQSMPNPSDKNVRGWNRWNVAAHKAAVAELAAKGLVPEEKRPKKTKVPRDSPDWPAMPLPELFEAAWKKAGSTPPV